MQTILLITESYSMYIRKHTSTAGADEIVSGPTGAGVDSVDDGTVVFTRVSHALDSCEAISCNDSVHDT